MTERPLTDDEKALDEKAFHLAVKWGGGEKTLAQIVAEKDRILKEWRQERNKQ